MSHALIKEALINFLLLLDKILNHHVGTMIYELITVLILRGPISSFVAEEQARDVTRSKWNVSCFPVPPTRPPPAAPPPLHAHSHVCILMKILISCLEISLKICMGLPWALEGSLKYVLAALLSPCL